MATGLRLFLRLPSCLRQQILAQESISVKAGIQQRHFSNRISLWSPKSSSKSTGKSSSSASKASAKTAVTRAPSPTVASKQQPPLSAPPKPFRRDDLRNAFIDAYQPLSNRILLYASPKHGTFFAASYLTGGFMLLGGYIYAEMFLKDRPGQNISWMLKSVSALSVVCVVVFGTAFILAPRRMIKSISIVRVKSSNKMATAGSRILRFEIKRALPFLQPDVLETLPQMVSLNRKVQLAVPELKYENIPGSQMQSFTERYFSPPESTSNGVLGALSSFSGSLLRIWPAMKRETRRMFLRDQMAYVTVEGHGSFKMDLQNCSMLDHGDPLYRTVGSHSDGAPSIVRWISQVLR